MIWLLLIVTLLSAYACYLIAQSRSADRVFWTVLGLLLGPIAIPFALFSRPQSR